VFEFVWSAERCVQGRDPETGDTIWFKDLRKVRRRGEHLSQVLIVDDSPEKVARDYGNVVDVSAWTGFEADNELLDLHSWLKGISRAEDFCSVEKRKWRMGFSDGE